MTDAEGRAIIEARRAAGEAIDDPQALLDPVRFLEREAEWALLMADDKPPANGDKPSRTVIAASADGMRLRAPKWLYDRRMPTDGITLLAGREGIGKSTIAFDLASRVTRGELPGRYQGTARSIGVIASEDSWESVILPRLMAARAQLSRVYRLEARTEDDKPDTVSAPADLDEVARVCAEHDIALIILDPVMSVIHGSLDTHKDREVRQALDPLARFCATKDVAVLGLIHVNKSGTSDPLNSIMASRAFTAVARSVLYCIVDPEAEQEDRFLFGHPKSNLGPKQPTIKYRLIECKIEVADAEDPQDAVILTSRVAWDGEDERSIRDAMEPQRAERPTGEVSHRIVDWLTRHGRAASAGEIADALSDVKRNTLDQNLARMVKREHLARPAHGLYALPAKPAVSDSQSDTSLETSEVSYVSELSERKINMTEMTELTLSGVSETPSERPSDWADRAYDREN